MPIYEFGCNACRRRISVFTRSVASDVTAVCSHCGSPDLSRIFSRVAVLRSGSDDFGSLDEGSLGDVDENDPKSVARWVRRMSREMGEPLDPQMESELEEMEAGRLPGDYDAGDDAVEEDFAGVE